MEFNNKKVRKSTTVEETKAKKMNGLTERKSGENPTVIYLLDLAKKKK